MTRIAICGQPMRRYEKPGRPAVPDWLICGRRPGHPGRHESTLYVRARANEKQAPAGSLLLAAAIRRARTEAGLSQRALSHQLGVSRPAIQQWERGTRTPAPENWVQLELALGPLGVVRDHRAEAGQDQQRQGEAA